ncbi:MAG: DUF6701 domain-containing protein [Gammaproteobacteria bacterium]|nr:DUF6701 domain-containing protein [Gammaproteobacteria bacterium]
MLKSEMRAGLLLALLASFSVHAGQPGSGGGVPTPMSCSPDVDLANVNEIKSKGGSVQPTVDYVEFKVLQDGTDTTGWQMCVSDDGVSIECFNVGDGDGSWKSLTQTVGEPDDINLYDANTWIYYNFNKVKAEEGEAILLDENGDVIDYIRWSNQSGICTATDFYWDVPSGCGTCFDERDPNEKDFARTSPDGTGNWGNNGDAPSEGQPNTDPSAPQADHFAIIHDGSAVNCQPEAITIVAHNADHTVLDTYVSTINLSTSSNNGDWSTNGTQNGTLTNTGNGSGSYAFAADDLGSVTLLLADTFVETITITASDGVASPDPAENPLLAYARSGFGFRSNGVIGQIPNQIAGKASNEGYGATVMEVEAINTNTNTGACEALFVGPENIDFALECDDPTSCGGVQATINGTSIPSVDDGQALSYQAVPLDFGDNTDSTAEYVFEYPDAGLLTLHVHYNPTSPSGEVLTGASTFIVRPFGFETGIATAGGTANPAATGNAGSIFAAAGDELRATIRAVAWQAADDTDVDGIPDAYSDGDPTTSTADLSDNASTVNFGQETVPAVVRLSASLWQPAVDPGIGEPGLAGTTTVSGFSSGSTSRDAIFIDDVGIYEVLANVDGNSYLGGEDVWGATGPAGRFVPGYFQVTVPTHGCDASSGTTYSGQEIGGTQVTAYANRGVGLVTDYYDGGQSPVFAKTTSLVETTGAAGSLSPSSLVPADFTRGIALLESSEINPADTGVSFTFTSSTTLPASILLRATDTDGVTSAGQLEEGTEVRSGRFYIADTATATTTDAQMRLRVQHYQDIGGANGWDTNPDHSCYTPVVGDFSLGNYTSNLAAGETSITGISFAAGAGSLTLSAPGTGNDGSVDVTGSVPSWLEFDWNGTGLELPVGTATFFGIYTTEDGFIDRTEIVR